MVDPDVPLDRVVMLSVPFARSLIEIQVVAKRELLQAAVLLGVGILNHDLSADVISVPVAFGQNRTDSFLRYVVLIHEASVVSDNDGLALVRREAFRIEHFLRKPELSADRTVVIAVLKNTNSGQDRPVHQIAFFR